MAYDKYTNASDDQFAAQLDEFKLGTTFHGGNDYEEGQAAFNNMPEAIAVGQMMAMRGNAQRDSLVTRKASFDDSAAAEGRALSDSFGKHLASTEGMTEVEKEAADSQWRKDNPSNYASMAIKTAAENQEWNTGTSLRSRTRANLGISAEADAKKGQYELDHFEKIRLEEQEKRDNEALAASANARFALDRVKEFKDKINEQTSETFMGGVASLDPKIRIPLAGLYQSLGKGEETEDLRKNLAHIVFATEASSRLAESQAIIGETHKNILGFLGSVSIDSTKADELVKNDPNAIEALKAARHDDRVYNSMKSSQQALQDKLMGTEEKADEKGNVVPAAPGLVERLKAARRKGDAGKLEVDEITGEMIAIAGPLEGYINNSIATQNRRLSERTEQTKLEKTRAEVKKIMAQTSGADSSSRYRDAMTAMLRNSKGEKNAEQKLRFIEDIRKANGADFQDDELEVLSNSYDNYKRVSGVTDTSDSSDPLADDF